VPFIGDEFRELSLIFSAFGFGKESRVPMNEAQSARIISGLIKTWREKPDLEVIRPVAGATDNQTCENTAESQRRRALNGARLRH